MRSGASTSACALLLALCAHAVEPPPSVTALESARLAAIDRVHGAVVAICGTRRAGGGSGVIIDEEGFALTNHHVVLPVGEEGLGGLADGTLSKLTVIGSDPGGDLALVRLHGRERWPVAPLGDSRAVRTGEWVLAMGNPFALAEDQRPTVTLGVVSGTGRYQSGQGNVGIYGECLQFSASINPGNSGGPLFDLAGTLIGINGRGAFEERGRVNVGLGFAISIEQAKNFLSDLRAAKICQHGTIDAVFADRDGRLMCVEINRDSPVAKHGLDLGDTLIAFDGQPMLNANHFAGVQSTLPAHCPVEVVYEHAKVRRTAWVRLTPLPYGEGPRQLRQPRAAQPGVKPIAGTPGKIRDAALNRAECERILRRWRRWSGAAGATGTAWTATGTWTAPGGASEPVRADLAADGTWRVLRGDGARWGGDAQGHWRRLPPPPGKAMAVERLDGAGAWREVPVAWAAALAASLVDKPAFAEWELEGGDRANCERIDRVRIGDGKAWTCRLGFSLFDATGAFATRLLAVMPDQSELAWTLHDCRPVGTVRLPHILRLVAGLAEEPRGELRLTWTAADGKSAPGSGDAP